MSEAETIEFEVKRTDPVTGEVTVTKEPLGSFMGRARFPDHSVQYAYLDRYAKSIAERKTQAEAKADALEVAKRMTLAQINSEEIPQQTTRKPLSETRVLFLIIRTIAFWTLSFVLTLCFLGLCAGIVVKCFKWIIG